MENGYLYPTIYGERPLPIHLQQPFTQSRHKSPTDSSGILRTGTPDENNDSACESDTFGDNSQDTVTIASIHKEGLRPLGAEIPRGLSCPDVITNGSYPQDPEFLRPPTRPRPVEKAASPEPRNQHKAISSNTMTPFLDGRHQKRSTTPETLPSE